MIRQDQVIGAFSLFHPDLSGFADGRIDLVRTFADQAVIAIENVRLFTELQVRTQELTRSVDELKALGEVGQAISSTLDLETVLSTIVSRAVQLSRLDGGVVFEYDEAAEEFIQRVATETGGALAEVRRTTRFRKGEGVLGRTAVTLEPVQVPDITIPGAYESRLRGTLLSPASEPSWRYPWSARTD
jgi:GAF domain-containing protein